jgi:hypothetical protein
MCTTKLPRAGKLFLFPRSAIFVKHPIQRSDNHANTNGICVVACAQPAIERILQCREFGGSGARKRTCEPFRIADVDLALLRVPLFCWRAAISSCLMAFGSARKARMCSTKRGATVEGSSFRFDGHVADIVTPDRFLRRTRPRRRDPRENHRRRNSSGCCRPCPWRARDWLRGWRS